jgi:hypothetical protein
VIHLHIPLPRELTVVGISRWLVVAVFVILGLTLLDANLTNLIQKHHWDELWRWPDQMLPDLSFLTNSQWFLPALWVSGGMAVGLWVVKLFPEQRNLRTASHAAAVTAPAGATLTGSAINPMSAPRKFYSKRNKSEIADALTDLTNVLNVAGEDILNNSQQIHYAWGHQGTVVGFGKEMDTATLMSHIDAVEHSISAFHQALFGDGGVIKKYRAYEDELNLVIQIQQNAPNSDPAGTLLRGIRALRNGVSSIERAKSHNDQQLISAMLATVGLAHEIVSSGDNGFRSWLNQTRQRMVAARSSVL